MSWATHAWWTSEIERQKKADGGSGKEMSASSTGALPAEFEVEARRVIWKNMTQVVAKSSFVYSCMCM